jgi:hypothetical protein
MWVIHRVLDKFTTRSRHVRDTFTTAESWGNDVKMIHRKNSLQQSRLCFDVMSRFGLLNHVMMSDGVKITWRHSGRRLAKSPAHSLLHDSFATGSRQDQTRSQQVHDKIHVWSCRERVVSRNLSWTSREWVVNESGMSNWSWSTCCCCRERVVSLSWTRWITALSPFFSWELDPSNNLNQPKLEEKTTSHCFGTVLRFYRLKRMKYSTLHTPASKDYKIDKIAGLIMHPPPPHSLEAIPFNSLSVIFTHVSLPNSSNKVRCDAFPYILHSGICFCSRQLHASLIEYVVDLCMPVTEIAIFAISSRNYRV